MTVPSCKSAYRECHCVVICFLDFVPCRCVGGALICDVHLMIWISRREFFFRSTLPPPLFLSPFAVQYSPANQSRCLLLVMFPSSTDSDRSSQEKWCSHPIIAQRKSFDPRLAHLLNTEPISTLLTGKYLEIRNHHRRITAAPSRPASDHRDIPSVDNVSRHLREENTRGESYLASCLGISPRPFTIPGKPDSKLFVSSHWRLEHFLEYQGY